MPRSAIPRLAYVALAMLFSAGSTFVLYVLARRLYDRATALVAASLLAVSPLFWFYGSVGLTYAGEAFAASVVAWFAYATLGGSARHLYWGALALGLTGGMRQSVLLLLLPLWLGCAVWGVRSRRRLALAGGILVASVLAWLVPMMWLSGGPAAYLAASTQLYGSVLLPTSVLGGSLEITLAQVRYLLESTLVGLGPLGLVALALPGVRAPRGLARARALPARVDAAGGDLLHARALRTGGLRADLPARARDPAEPGARVGGRGGLRAAAPAQLALGAHRRRGAAAGADQYRLLRERASAAARVRPPGGGDTWFWRARDEFHDWIMSRTAAALREHEAVIRTYVETIRTVYEPSDTALVTELGNPRSYPWLRHAMFYMPEYPIYQVQVGPHAARLLRAAILRHHDPHAGLAHPAARRDSTARLVRRSLGSRDAAARGPAGGPAPVRPLPVRPAAHPHARRVRRLHLRARRPVRGRTLAVVAPVVALTLAIGLFVVKTRRLAGVLGVEAFPLDDSWIHLQFARNLAEGHGFSYNPGVPVSGSTAPLWTLALGGMFAVLGNHAVLAKVLGVAATLATAWLAGRLALIWTGRHQVALLASGSWRWPGRWSGARCPAWRSRWPRCW